MTMSIKRNIKTILKLLQRKKVTKADIVLLSPNQRLVRKKVIITGGNRGLGFAMAKKFTDEGAEVLITGRDEEKLEKAAKEIGCKYMQYDVTDFTHMDEFIKEADDLLGGANVLVNNAGISLHEGTIMDVHYEQFDKQIETNLKGAYFLSQKFLRMYEKKHRNGGSSPRNNQRNTPCSSTSHSFRNSKAINIKVVDFLLHSDVEDRIRYDACKGRKVLKETLLWLKE